MNLIDIGINLTHDSFDHDRPVLIARARAAGVAGFIITGTDVAGSRDALRMAGGDPQFFSTAGVHPHHAGGLDSEGMAALRELLDDDRVVAVGECGLDFFRNFSPREEQRRAFEMQLDLAAETGKPLFLHQRDAHTELMQRLHARRNELAGGVVHCFTDGPVELADVIEAGFYVGITGWLCDERRGQALRDAVRELPLDRFMVETDAPYLLPRDLPESLRAEAGRRNEPRFLPHIVAHLATLTGREPVEIARFATENARRLFRLPAEG
ncbi:MAG TPA: TatD family hydrolase [Gammaproteobacteria bacterium]